MRSSDTWSNRSAACTFSSARSSKRAASSSSDAICALSRFSSAANGGPWKGLDDLEIATCAWVSWFNEERLHSELGDRTPAEVEADYRQRSQPDAA